MFPPLSQNTDKSKDWYKSMFKQIHRIPGKVQRSPSPYVCVCLCLCACVFVSVCVCVCVCVFCSQSSVLPKRCVLPVNSLSLYVSTIAHRSETPEENPYRPTYMFPENYDRLVVRSKGIQWR